jgi:ribonuclease HI
MNKERAPGSMVTIYTDGGAAPNPGPGAWAALLMFRDSARFVSGFDPHATNNQMELLAAISGLKTLNRATAAEVYTDSRYLQDGINKWIHAWEQRNWLTAHKKPVLNQDLWRQLMEQEKNHQVVWIWVRGHASSRYNQFVDLLATATIANRKGFDRKMNRTELERKIDIALSSQGRELSEILSL